MAIKAGRAGAGMPFAIFIAHKIRCVRAGIVALARCAIEMAADTGRITALHIMTRRTRFDISPGQRGMPPAAAANTDADKARALVR